MLSLSPYPLLPIILTTAAHQASRFAECAMLNSIFRHHATHTRIVPAPGPSSLTARVSTSAQVQPERYVGYGLGYANRTVRPFQKADLHTQSQNQSQKQRPRTILVPPTKTAQSLSRACSANLTSRTGMPTTRYHTKFSTTSGRRAFHSTRQNSGPWIPALLGLLKVSLISVLCCLWVWKSGKEDWLFTTKTSFLPGGCVRLVS